MKAIAKIAMVLAGMTGLVASAVAGNRGTSLRFLDQLLAGSAKMVNDIFAGLTQIHTNAAGYTFRILSGFKGILLGKAAVMPAPTPFLQYTDSGTSVAQQAGYVGRVAIEGLVDGGVAFYKMGADLVQGKWNDARDHGFEALTMLVGAKLGETTPTWRNIALKTKQVAFDVLEATYGVVKQTARAIWESEAVRGVRRAVGDAVETVRTVFLREKTIPSSDPALPAVRTTEVLSPEQVVQEHRGELYRAPNGQVIEVPGCFDMDTQVATKRGYGLTNICDVQVGDEVLSRNEVTGEQAYRRVLNTFVHHRKWTYRVKFSADGLLDAVSATPEHPFWVVGKGWVPTCELQAGQELEICVDPSAVDTGSPEDLERMLDRRLNGKRWTAKVVSVEPRKELPLTVYNLEVEEFHTYFVGAYGAWVHNTKDHFAGGATQPIVLETPTPNAKPLVVFKRDSLPTGGKVGEYEAADTLAKNGLDIVHLKDGDINILGKDGGRPDLLINGRTADVYTPKAIDALKETVADKLKAIRNEIVNKTTYQSSDIVLNLRETPEISVRDIHDYLNQNPVDGLGHLYILKDGAVTFREYRPNGQNYAIYGYVDCKNGNYLYSLPQEPSKGYVGDPAKNYGAYNLEVGAEGAAVNIAPLTTADINALLPAAKQYWLNAGALSSVLDGIQFNIGSLPTGVAAQAQYNKITLSEDGAGWGWFVDPTPMDSLEFINSTSSQMIAPADSAASGKLDLLTVMIHEMGHALGLRHDAEGAMESILQPGERNLPSDLEAALLQNIRNAVTAQASASAAPATPATQYQVVANAAFTGLDTPTGWNTLGSVEFRGQTTADGGQGITVALNEVSATTRKEYAGGYPATS